MASKGGALTIQIRISFAGKCLIWAAQTSAWLMMPPDVNAVVESIKRRHLWVKVGSGPWRRYGGRKAHE